MQSPGYFPGPTDSNCNLDRSFPDCNMPFNSLGVLSKCRYAFSCLALDPEILHF